jgi:hypothetical protein
MSTRAACTCEGQTRKSTFPDRFAMGGPLKSARPDAESGTGTSTEWQATSWDCEAASSLWPPRAELSENAVCFPHAFCAARAPAGVVFGLELGMREFAGGNWHSEWIFREGWEALGSTVQWCHLLTDNQRLLLPTSVVVVTLLWSKMCPRPPRLPAEREGDAELYAESMNRWLGKSTPAD